MQKYIELIKNNVDKFGVYYQELVSYNEKVNLTAITEENEVYIKHFLDSILGVGEIKHGASVVDVGTGAGFPSLPIKIVRPDVKLTMVDALNKRVNFLNELTQKLNITTTNIHARAEDFCKTGRGKFDVAVARAVARLNTLLEYLLPLVKVGGVVLAYKGSSSVEELRESKNAIKLLGGEYVKTLHFTLPNNLDIEQSNSINNSNSAPSLKTNIPSLQNNNTNNNSLLQNNTDIQNTMGERNIIVIKKVKPTPKEYPRPQNKPKTKPIL